MIDNYISIKLGRRDMLSVIKAVDRLGSGPRVDHILPLATGGGFLGTNVYTYELILYIPSEERIETSEDLEKHLGLYPHGYYVLSSDDFVVLH